MDLCNGLLYRLMWVRILPRVLIYPTKSYQELIVAFIKKKVLYYKGILDKINIHLITEITEPEANSRTFADNWMDSMSETLELLLSNAIWERSDTNPNQEIVITKRQLETPNGLSQTVYYLDDKPVLMFSKSYGDVKGIPLHYTICI